MLTISNVQKVQFQRKFDESVIVEIEAFIKEHTSAFEVESVEVNARARAALHRGRELGLRSMGSFCLFGLLAFETGGEAMSSRELERALTEPNVSPDAALDQVLNVSSLLSDQEQI